MLIWEHHLTSVHQCGLLYFLLWWFNLIFNLIFKRYNLAFLLDIVFTSFKYGLFVYFSIIILSLLSPSLKSKRQLIKTNESVYSKFWLILAADSSWWHSFWRMIFFFVSDWYYFWRMVLLFPNNAGVTRCESGVEQTHLKNEFRKTLLFEHNGHKFQIDFKTSHDDFFYCNLYFRNLISKSLLCKPLQW